MLYVGGGIKSSFTNQQLRAIGVDGFTRHILTLAEVTL